MLFPDDGQRHEIIDGVHYVTPCPTMQHQRLLGEIYFELSLYLRQHPGLGEAFLSPFDVVLSTWDVVEPDLLLILETQKSILTEANVQGAPAIVVEILSPSTRRRDQTIKRKLFERAGVLEYWLVDPRDSAVSVFRRDGDRFTVPEMLPAAAILTTALLPGFSLAVSELFKPR
jgi:Uma2 family endonuclease